MITDKIVIPLLKAAITGLLVALFVASWLIPSIPWKLFTAILSGVSLVSWLAVIIPRPSHLLETKVYPTTTKIEIVATDPSGQFSAGRWADLSISPMVMVTIARRIAVGASFSHAGLAGPGRPLSRSEFEVLRDEFIARGLAYWINDAAHAQGCELTKAGGAVMRHFAHRDRTVTSLPQLPPLAPMESELPKAAHARGRTREVIIDN